MTNWIRWTAPAVIAVTTVCPVQAVEYLSVAAAQKLAFPGASRFPNWSRGDPGRQLLANVSSDYSSSTMLSGSIFISIMRSPCRPTAEFTGSIFCNIAESYGGEVRSESWLAQFIGEVSGEFAQSRGRHSHYFGRHSLIRACHRRRKESACPLWNAIACAVRSPCSALSSRFGRPALQR